MLAKLRPAEVSPGGCGFIHTPDFPEISQVTRMPVSLIDEHPHRHIINASRTTIRQALHHQRIVDLSKSRPVLPLLMDAGRTSPSNWSRMNELPAKAGDLLQTPLHTTT
jgi:hypothetical protein